MTAQFPVKFDVLFKVWASPLTPFVHIEQVHMLKGRALV